MEQYPQQRHAAEGTAPERMLGYIRQEQPGMGHALPGGMKVQGTAGKSWGLTQGISGRPDSHDELNGGYIPAGHRKGDRNREHNLQRRTFAKGAR